MPGGERSAGLVVIVGEDSLVMLTGVSKYVSKQRERARWFSTGRALREQ